ARTGAGRVLLQRPRGYGGAPSRRLAPRGRGQRRQLRRRRRDRGADRRRPADQPAVHPADRAEHRSGTAPDGGRAARGAGRGGRVVREHPCSWLATVITLFPEMFPGPLGYSLAGRALEEGRWRLEPVQLRDFATDRHRTVDDVPFGGGAGMVMRPDVVARAIDAVRAKGPERPALFLTPRGRRLTQRRVEELAAEAGVVVLCGRFEGVDQRVIEARGLEELSLGDIVLSGGEPAAIA